MLNPFLALRDVTLSRLVPYSGLKNTDVNCGVHTIQSLCCRQNACHVLLASAMNLPVGLSLRLALPSNVSTPVLR